MPKLPTDYSKTIIYKICCNDENIKDIYIGHTTDLVKRRYCHKSSCNNENKKHYHCKLYKCIRDNGNWNNWSIVAIEEFPCENAIQARIRERYWLETLKATLNKNIPSRTGKERCCVRYKENKEYSLQKQKEYYEKNRESVLEYLKQWRLKNIEKTKKLNIEWRKENKEYKSKSDKEYYEKNKSKLNEKIVCKCGCQVNYQGLSRHLKTKKHQDYLSLLS